MTQNILPHAKCREGWTWPLHPGGCHPGPTRVAPVVLAPLAIPLDRVLVVVVPRGPSLAWTHYQCPTDQSALALSLPLLTSSFIS
jgi:hypothetical protein